ncbi:hypothetical protein [Frankia sp. Cas3]|uniref:hypothetical protein n=1 Tax=Frankia sp. Cas3 TaxID=3073926 RepID=UPI002AD4371C|nr:hypothetical protein [Frankia sp. Cas3]
MVAPLALRVSSGPDQPPRAHGTDPTIRSVLRPDGGDGVVIKDGWLWGRAQQSFVES